MSHLKILIINNNDMVSLTEASISNNCPGAEYNVVNADQSKIAACLRASDTPILAVGSGCYVRVQEGDLPPDSVLDQYQIALSREFVYWDHDRLCGSYQASLGYVPNAGVVDLSVFYLNPNKWDGLPARDAGVLDGAKKLFMPRYMNHKTDVLFQRKAIGARDAFVYGMLGKKAAILNYTPNILSGKATVEETYAYNFDALADSAGDLPKPYYDNVMYLAERTTDRISSLRNRIFDLEELYSRGT